MIPQNKTNQKMVSIILPVYNGEKFLATSIKSCIDQTYRNIELIIVDDCSTDNSLKIAEKFKKFDDRISIISNLKNKKLPASLNLGHRLAKGNYITWTSDDNFFELNAIEKLLTGLINSSSDIIYSNFNIIEESGNFRKELKMEDASPLLFGNSIGASFLYKKQVFVRNLAYNENLHTVEDYDFWLRAMLHSRFTHLPQSLYNFRSHNSSLSYKLRVKDTPERKLFIENLKCCYQNFLSHLGKTEVEKNAELLTRIHQYQEINVLSFLKDYLRFEKILKGIAEKTEFFKNEEIVQDLDIRIRANIQQYRNNQSISVLLTILKKRPDLLWKYDRKNSLRIIQKCLKYNG